MTVLQRQSSTFLLGGGALMAVFLLLMTVAPASPAINGFFVVAPAIGLGALGSLLASDRRRGPLGQLSGWVAALGGIAVVVVGAFAIATYGSIAAVGEDDPLAIPFAVTSTAWMIGSLGVALALVRRGRILPIGAWVVLGGTVTALVLGTILATVAPALSPLSAVPFAVGWVLVGLGTRRVA